MKPLNDELLSLVGGGYEIEHLTPEEYAELEKWGNIYLEESMKHLYDDKTFSPERLEEARQQLDRLDQLYKEKYGN